MKKSMHIKLEHEEAIDAKKQILESEINILNILQRVKNYRIARKRELILKNRLKQKLKSINSEISQIENALPTDHHEIGVRQIKKKAKKQEQHSRNIEVQLQDIQEKLAKLNQ